jgi:hypothetical protein
MKDRNFSPRHMDNSDEVSEMNHKLLTNFSALVQQRTQKGPSLQ